MRSAEFETRTFLYENCKIWDFTLKIGLKAKSADFAGAQRIGPLICRERFRKLVGRTAKWPVLGMGFSRCSFGPVKPFPLGGGLSY